MGSSMMDLARSPHLPSVLLILLQISTILLITGAEQAAKETTKRCSSQQTCLPVQSCPYYQDKITKRNQLSSGSQERRQLENILKDEVCNRNEKAFCCPCKNGEVCIPSSKCGYIQNKIADHARLKATSPNEAARILAEVRGKICDKEDHLVCCPRALLPKLGNCGVNPKENGRQVIGGTNTQAGEFPWAVLLGSNRIKTRKVFNRVIEYNETRWFCGGVLINTQFVLTAAHCQGQHNSQKISKLRLGEWCVAGFSRPCSARESLPPVQDFDILESSVIKHESYTTQLQNGFQNIINDIALIRLPRPAVLNRGVQLVCLPHIPFEYRKELGVKNIESDIEGTKVTLVGWGFTLGFDPWSNEENQGDTEFFGVPSRMQQKVELPLLSSSTCQDLYDDFKPLRSQICAGGEKEKDSCKGDSGGGIFAQRRSERPSYLLGIVSFGSTKCGDGRPGIYTRVSEFIPWIEKNIV